MAERLDLEKATPTEIYNGISEMDEDEFEGLMDDGRSRELIIGALLDHMSTLLRPDEAEGLDKTIHFKLWDRPGGGYDHFEMVIVDQSCSISTEPERDADLTIKIRPTDLRKLITGETGPKRLALRRRFTALGDIKLGMRLPELFDLDPK